MRLAIVKQRYVPGYTRYSQRWVSSGALMQGYMFRSKNFGLLCETEGDVWVMEDNPEWKSDTYERMLEQRPDEIRLLYQAQEAVAWADVHWWEYDVVISVDPIVPQRIIERFPSVLWCYYAAEHSSKIWGGSLKRPQRGYDLFLDHCYQTDVPIADKLPLSVHFPAVVSRRAFAQVIDLANKHERVFLDSHAMRGVEDLGAFRERLGELFGVAVTHPRPWAFEASYGAIAQCEPMGTREFLQTVAGCTYMVVARQGGVGQAAIEAAALGCAVISGPSKYAALMCHPDMIGDANNWDWVAERIRELKGGRLGEVLAYQKARLEPEFLRKPLATLQRYWRLKWEGV